MKCDYCGSNLTIDDKVCPYCHQPNKHYVKHRQDMFHYETDYQNTKSEVYEKAGKTSRRAARIAVLAVMVMLVLGAVVVNVYVWDIRRAVNMYGEKKHLTEYQTQLDAYAEKGDWTGYYNFLNDRDLVYYDFDNTEFEHYQQFGRLAGTYHDIWEMCSRLVEHNNGNGYDSYFDPDKCLENISDDLVYLYRNVSEDYYYVEMYRHHTEWCENLISQAEALVQAYVGVDGEVFAGKSIRQMSNTKILVLLERSYEKDE